MKYIKSFNESFTYLCQRCGEESNILSDSMYTNQKICLKCKKEENDGKIVASDFVNLKNMYIRTDTPIFPQTTPSQIIDKL